MLMKQQDRLEEREQDIEDQLYKLESDKRLVEVAKPKFMVLGGGGLGAGPWARIYYMVGSVPEPLGQSFSELLVDEPHLCHGQVAQSHVLPPGSWQTLPSGALGSLGVWGPRFHHPGCEAARGSQCSSACPLLPPVRAGESESAEGGGAAAV